MNGVVRYYADLIYRANLRTNEEFDKTVEEARNSLLKAEYKQVRRELGEDGIEIPDWDDFE